MRGSLREGYGAIEVLRMKRATKGDNDSEDQLGATCEHQVMEVLKSKCSCSLAGLA